MDALEPLIPNPPYEREIFANRTLNLRTIQAIGYDMDYTLINYDVARWQDAIIVYLSLYLVCWIRCRTGLELTVAK